MGPLVRGLERLQVHLPQLPAGLPCGECGLQACRRPAWAHVPRQRRLLHPRRHLPAGLLAPRGRPPLPGELRPAPRVRLRPRRLRRPVRRILLGHESPPARSDRGEGGRRGRRRPLDRRDRLREGSAQRQPDLRVAPRQSARHRNVAEEPLRTTARADPAADRRDGAGARGLQRRGRGARPRREPAARAPEARVRDRRP